MCHWITLLSHGYWFIDVAKLVLDNCSHLDQSDFIDSRRKKLVFLKPPGDRADTSFHSAIAKNWKDVVESFLDLIKTDPGLFEYLKLDVCPSVLHVAIDYNRE